MFRIAGLASTRALFKACPGRALTVTAAGETWVDSIPVVEEDGTSNLAFALFFVVYTLVVTWVMLQLSVVVLLDNFSKASAIIEHEEEDRVLAEKGLDGLQSPMAPLLRKLAEEFVNNEDLSLRLQNLYKVLACVCDNRCVWVMIAQVHLNVIHLC